LRIAGWQNIAQIVSALPLGRRWFMPRGGEVDGQAVVGEVVDRAWTVRKQLAAHADDEFGGVMTRQCVRVVQDLRPSIYANSVAVAVELYEQQADIRIAADISQRPVHRIAVIFGKLQSAGSDDMNETWRSGAHAAIDMLAERGADEEE